MASDEKSTAEKLKSLAEFKATIERKIADAQAELESLKVLLEFVDKALLENSFRRAKMPKPKSGDTPSLPSGLESQDAIRLETVRGEILANLFIDGDSMRVVIAEGRIFSADTHPFRQFLIERVLNKMQEKDNRAVTSGIITPEKVISYELTLDGDTIREIAIRPITPDRLRELQSSIRWTLEKMHEKAKRHS